MKKILTVAALAVASLTAVAAEPGTLDAAKEAAKKFVSLIQGVKVEDVATRGAVFKDGWAAVTTVAQGKECVMQLHPNAAQNVYGWEVKQYECHPSSGDAKEGSAGSGTSR